MLIPLDTIPNAPWKLRFRAPSVAMAQIARNNPDRGLVVTTNTGQYQLYAWDVPENALRQLTFKPEGVVGGTISPDGHDVYFMQDDNGNEIGHFVRIPFEEGQAEDITPDMELYSAFGLSFSREGNLLGSVISNDHGFHAVVIPLSQTGGWGIPAEFHNSDRLMFGPMLSTRGEIAVIVSTEKSVYQHTVLLAFDLRQHQLVGELAEDKASLMAFAFSPIPGDLRLAGSTTGSGYSRPFIWDLATGRRHDLNLPDLEGDVSISDWSEDANLLLLTRSFKAEQKLALYDIRRGSVEELKHPPGFYGTGAPFAPALQFHQGQIISIWQDAANPPQLIALNPDGEKSRTIIAAGKIPPGRPFKSIECTSTDGERIQGWLATPPGKGPFPTILHVHGGPETQTVEYFMPNAQAWLDHGFAWLSLNYRGSSGFGRSFREKIWGNIGRWEIADMVAAREWLVREGIADPARVIPHGWSYGGYLTLLALGKYPDLWAAGLAGTATVDWAMEFEDLSPAMRGYSVALLGGTPQEKPEIYAAFSPINYVENVKAPVLVIQGKNDTRTPARPVAVYEQKMRELGKEIEVCWYNEGHAGGGIEQEIEHQEIMMRFAYKVFNRPKI